MVVTPKGPGDLVTEVDHLCEDILVDGIRSAFPDHHVVSEERGSVGPNSDWCWLIDPLDGTNNYALGLPLYGCSLALSHCGKYVLGVVHDAHHDRTLGGAVGLGAYEGQQRLSINWQRRPDAALTVGWTQGYAVGADPTARRVRDQLELRCKRVLANWSPVIDMILLSTGGLDAFVSFDSELTDFAAGLVLIPEAGGLVADFEGRAPPRY